MADAIYNGFKKEIMAGNHDLDTDTYYVMLVTSAYLLDQDAHLDRNDISGEITGTGYTAGGAEITGKAVTADNTDNEGVWDGNDVTWASSTLTAGGAIIYKSTGVILNDLLVCYLDFGGDQSSSSGDFTIQWGSEGILNLN